MIQAQEIELKKLSVNKGQIEGVPTNPRKATKEQIKNMKKSIVAGLKRRGKSSKEAWSLVNSKYKTLQNSNSGKPITLKEIIDKF